MLEVVRPELHCETADVCNTPPSDMKGNGNDIILEENVSSPLLHIIEDHMVSNTSSSNAMDMDLVRNNCNELQASDITNKCSNSLVEEGVNLIEGVKTDLSKNDAAYRICLNSPKLKCYESKRNKKADCKGQSKLSQYEPAKGNILTSSQVNPTFTSDNNPSTSGIEGIQLMKRNSNEASNYLISPTKKECLSKNADADMEKNNMSLDVDSDSVALKNSTSHELDSNSFEVNTNTKQYERQMKREKKDASQNNYAECSLVPIVESNSASNMPSFPVSDEVDIVRDINFEASINSSMVSEVLKESDTMPEDANANSTQGEPSPKIKLQSVVVSNSISYSRRKFKHEKKEKAFDHSQDKLDIDRCDPSVTSSLLKSAEMQLVGQYGFDAFGKSSMIDLKKGNNSVDLRDGSNIPHEMDTDSREGEKLSVVETKAEREKEINGNLDSSSININQLQADMVNTSVLVVTAGDADISSEVSGSEKVPHQREVVSVPPSPIRGVVDDIASPDLSDKQNNLNSFREKEIEAGSENGKSTIPEDNVPDCADVCNPSKRTVLVEKSHKEEDVVSSEMIGDAVTVSLGRSVMTRRRRKLLVLDLNGLLADVTIDFRYAQYAHKRIGRKAVFKRPFYDDFLRFCFEKYDVGVWSSRRKNNVDDLVDYLMRDNKQKLLFCWDQSKCTDTGYNTVENMQKPLLLKELKKQWNKEEPDLPWEKGEYSPSNTLLVDDSPYKALCNPPYTAIFPRPYRSNDENDSSLGSGGDLRVYLEGVATAEDVQKYVEDHPFGQCAITSANPSWKFYRRIIERMENSTAPT